MVQIQIKQKQEVIDVDDVQLVSEPASYATLEVCKRVERKKMSPLGGLMLLGTGVLLVMLGSWMVWGQKVVKHNQVVLDEIIQIVEMVPSELGQHIDLTVTCTFATGAAPWTKDCSCSGIFHCGCVLEVTQCMKGGGCANICFGKQEQSLEVV
eukprot:GFUD01071632.1.p1 GENE.GFUD01071632.1~~GFUD01071632.1.p1  ORF type:complete len:153 (+),score=45.72 GFUD01071632.1:76-534(+)